NVYDWPADGQLVVKGANNPYATRIVVRRPAQAARFSGTVIAEIPNIARRFDWPMIWGFSHDYWMEHGDAWVQIGMPASVASMKKFDPARYGALSFDNTTKVCPGETEDGLRYDMLSQVAAALKSKAAGMPLASLNVGRLFLSTQDTGMVTYINAFHEKARLEGGKPTYDGYLIKVLNAPGPINSCGRPLANNDPRRMLKAVDVPTITVVAQGEVEGMAWSRKADSDEAVGKHRRYEVAMASHIDKWAYTGLASFADQNKVGTAQGTPDWPFTARCEPEINLQDEPLLSYAFSNAFALLDKWVRDGVAPPKVDRMQLDAAGKMPVNAYGIGSGGIRSPYSDVPTASYLTASGGTGNCREFGSTHPLAWSELEKLYGTHAAYVQKVNASIDRMVKERWITESDAKRMRANLTK
ncbi:MAG: alpha/beta hydrolase domain-containing protein, partial [Acidobacteriota bacterium]